MSYYLGTALGALSVGVFAALGGEYPLAFAVGIAIGSAAMAVFS